jgi:hypothetical protein
MSIYNTPTPKREREGRSQRGAKEKKNSTKRKGEFLRVSQRGRRAGKE